MFFALSDQLDLVKDIEIPHDELRRTVVHYLWENPRLVSTFFTCLSGCTHLQKKRVAVAFDRYSVSISLKVEKKNKALSTRIRNTRPHEVYLNLFHPST